MQQYFISQARDRIYKGWKRENLSAFRKICKSRSDKQTAELMLWDKIHLQDLNLNLDVYLVSGKYKVSDNSTQQHGVYWQQQNGQENNIQ